MSPKKSSGSGLVFSTEQGRSCPSCQKPSIQCSCRKTAPVSLSDGIVRISMETKGRKGKGVTLVRGLPCDQDELRKIVRDLKKQCGCGGALKEGAVEIQGDHRDMLMAELAARGYKVKRAGG